MAGGYLTENMVAVLGGLLSAALLLGVMAAVFAPMNRYQRVNPLGVLAVPLCVAVGGVIAGGLMTARRIAPMPQSVLTERPRASLLVVPWRHALIVAPGFLAGVAYVALSRGDGWDILLMPVWVAVSYLACLAAYCRRWLGCRPPLFGVLIGGLAYYGLAIYQRLAPADPSVSGLWLFLMWMYALWPACIAVPLGWSVYRLQRTGEL